MSKKTVVQIKTDHDPKTGNITAEVYNNGELMTAFVVPFQIIPDLQRALSGETIRMFIKPKETSNILQPTTGESIRLS